MRRLAFGHPNRQHRSLLCVILYCACLWGGIQTGGARAADKSPPAEHIEFFERQVRPLLVEHCYSCHAKGQKKGGLSLDSRENLLTGGDSGTAVTPGKPSESLLALALTYEAATQMPPSGRLSDSQIGVIKKWIELGAPWPASPASTGGDLRNHGQITMEDRGFWSFRVPVRSTPPDVRAVEWSQTPLDRFIQVEHEREGLKPAPDADRRSLGRRLALDLTGLPLAADSADEFADDSSPDAVARLVDRLLASPRLGERWGRHWLDIARFGEDQAHTFQARMYPEGHRYRDWVVASFNEDRPYDSFLRNQIAADLFASDGPKEDLAALGFFALGPVYYADAGCAPKALADEWDDRLDTLSRGILGLTVACARCHDHKFDPISMRDYYGLAGVFASSKYEELPLAPKEVVERYNAAQAAVKEQEKVVNDERTAASRRLSESYAAGLSQQIVAAWTVIQRRRTDPKFSVQEVAKTESLPEFLVESWVKLLTSDQVGKRSTLAPWKRLVESQDSGRNLADDAAARESALAAAREIESPVVAAIARRTELENAYRAALAAAPDEAARAKVARPALEKEHAERIREWIEDNKSPLAVPKEKLDAAVDEATREKLKASQAELEQRKKAVGPKYAYAHGLSDGDAKNLKIHLRGDHKKLGDEAPRRFLEILSSANAASVTSGSGRRELAQAIASPENPLTARVFVNRVWQLRFGRGIVATPSNFGTLGARPSHPQLLDDLAVRFMEQGWSTKWLQREISLSRTYQLSASRTSENQSRDADNRWLWRANRRRLDVEAWRDSLLSAAGSLELRMGGPGDDLTSANHRRRTLYSKVSRHDLNPMLRLFDFPDPNLTSEQRVVTTVPLQQLFALNSDFMVRPARDLATRLEKAGEADDEGRIKYLYRTVFTRSPTDEEIQLAKQFLSLAATADAKLPPWVQYCQALLATNELQFLD